jgi:hypothetical protein
MWNALAGSAGQRTRDLLWQLVTSGVVSEDDARGPRRRPHGNAPGIPVCAKLTSTTGQGA